MRAVEETDLETTLPIDALRSVFSNHPVRLAILFGSYAAEQRHARSDVDIAVELTDIDPTDTNYNETFFALSVDVSRVLETDDVDVVDVHTLPPSLTRPVLEDGVLLYGERERAETLSEQRTDSHDSESPRERLDDALQRIDEHLA